ncbi:ribosomal L1 domain-containing protein 1 [Nerophis lumbriciformis]|uniref:ribosomal L1 domain-containing protein 1 n=1 Tax=Nerophis lumbriciformis TaxID=546530 RepID=UPI002ADF52D7|nr:ribosomal L1 domain-containing protein 1-like isoform X1 [Nerophis lumbriciformis]
MGDKMQVELDQTQVKKAVLALQAFLKSKAGGESLFQDESQKISLLFTFWGIPCRSQTFLIPLPHGQRTDVEEVCLFTRDEPKMTTDQTQRFYKRLLEERGVKTITEIIPFDVLRKEYKPYEAKRRLLGNFDMFLSDSRIRHLLPSHIGKKFYDMKKEPISVNMESKHLARDLQRIIQGTVAKVNNKGSCCMVRVGHSGMAADELTENIEVVVKSLAEILNKGPRMKIIHLKSEKSVALPIYTSDLSHITDPKAKKEKEAPSKAKAKNPTEDTKETAEDGEQKGKKRKLEKDEDGEEIPQLVPIEMSSKTPKLQSEQMQRKKTAASGAKTQAAILRRLIKGSGKTKPKGKVPRGKVPRGKVPRGKVPRGKVAKVR